MSTITTNELALTLADRFEEIARELREQFEVDLPEAVPARSIETVGTAKAPVSFSSIISRSAGTPATASSSTVLPSPGGWVKVDELEGQTYGWPKKPTDLKRPVDVYEAFPVYEKDGIRLGLGYTDKATIMDSRRKVPYVVVFEVKASGKGDGIVIFTATTDYETSGDLAAVIKGKGETGNEMYAPGDELPAIYEQFEIDIHNQRVKGPYAYNRLCVIAPGGDVNVMLDHALVLKRLRGF